MKEIIGTSRIQTHQYFIELVSRFSFILFFRHKFFPHYTFLSISLSILTKAFILSLRGYSVSLFSSNKCICSNCSYWPSPCFLSFFLSSSLQMDVVYTFQTGQTAVPGALRRQPSVVSQQNDAKTVVSPTHVGISSSSLSANSAAAAGLPAPASSSTTGSECHITRSRCCMTAMLNAFITRMLSNLAYNPLTTLVCTLRFHSLSFIFSSPSSLQR